MLTDLVQLRPYRVPLAYRIANYLYTFAKQMSELCEPRDQKELGARHAHLADEVEAKSREQPLEAQRIAAVLA